MPTRRRRPIIPKLRLPKRLLRRRRRRTTRTLSLGRSNKLKPQLPDQINPRRQDGRRRRDRDGRTEHDPGSEEGVLEARRVALPGSPVDAGVGAHGEVGGDFFRGFEDRAEGVAGEGGVLEVDGGEDGFAEAVGGAV